MNFTALFIIVFLIVVFRELIRKRKMKTKKKQYDRDNKIPVLRCSICTGEEVAGFKDIHTGRFEDIMLIRNDSDLREFMEAYGIDSITREY